MNQFLKDFLKQESAGGIVLVLAAVLALICNNLDLTSKAYQSFIHFDLIPAHTEHVETPATHDHPPATETSATTVEQTFTEDTPTTEHMEVHEPHGFTVHHFIDDALMAIFFLLVGLEIKREMLEGELSNPAQVVLPAVAAIGGMVVPALIFYAFTFNYPDYVVGWAIPAATDIAFAVGVISLFGKRVPLSLKVFLLTLAIIDDLGAIIIIALFYSSNINIVALLLSAVVLVLLYAINKAKVHSLIPYLILGVILWFLVFKSGLHATLAGVILAFTIPLRTGDKEHNPLHTLEHGLHPYVNFIILPIFAFANAGVSLQGIGMDDLTHPLSMGSALGLFVGKQIGIFGCSFALIKMGYAKLPTGATWFQMYAVTILCGIGFTMSLFIAGLANTNGLESFDTASKLGVLSGSILAAVVGYVVMSIATSGNKVEAIEPVK